MLFKIFQLLIILFTNLFCPFFAEPKHNYFTQDPRCLLPGLFSHCLWQGRGQWCGSYILWYLTWMTDKGHQNGKVGIFSAPETVDLLTSTINTWYLLILTRKSMTLYCSGSALTALTKYDNKAGPHVSLETWWWFLFVKGVNSILQSFAKYNNLILGEDLSFASLKVL